MNTKIAGGSLKRKDNTVILRMPHYIIKGDFKTSKRTCYLKISARYDDELYAKKKDIEGGGPAGLLVDGNIESYTLERSVDIWAHQFPGSKYHLTDLWLSDYVSTPGMDRTQWLHSSIS